MQNYIFNRFPRDVRTYQIDKQFLIGPGILITPVITQGATRVVGYFPASHWYDFRTGELIVRESENGKFVNLNAPIDYIPVHVRGGHIIPTQEPGLTTEGSRNNPFGLIVAPDELTDAHGSLFYDDGESDLSSGNYYLATYSLRDNVLRVEVERDGYNNMSAKVLNTIRILYRVAPGIKFNFVFDNREWLSESKINYETHQIVLSDLNIPMNRSFVLEWELEPFYPPGSLGPVIDCALDKPFISQAECEARGCKFFVNRTQSVPFCIIPENKGGYTIDSQNGNEYNLLVADNTFQLFPNNLENLLLTVSHGSALSSREFRMTRITVIVLTKN